jgi:hypothetical protein
MRDKHGRLRSPLTSEERADLVAKLRERAERESGLSPEQRADLRRKADNLERIGRHMDAKRARQRAESWQQRMLSSSELAQLFEEASSSNWGHSADELSHDDMLNLADLFTGWAMSGQTDPQWSARLLGWAKSLEALAIRFGPDWDPPEPKRLSLIGFIARQVRSAGT